MTFVCHFKCSKHTKYHFGGTKPVTNSQNVVDDKRYLWQCIQLTPFLPTHFACWFSQCVCALKIRLICFIFFIFHSHKSCVWRSVCKSGHVFWYARLSSVVYVSVFRAESRYAQRTRQQNFICKSNFAAPLCALYSIVHRGKKFINDKYDFVFWLFLVIFCIFFATKLFQLTVKLLLVGHFAERWCYS